MVPLFQHNPPGARHASRHEDRGRTNVEGNIVRCKELVAAILELSNVDTESLDEELYLNALVRHSVILLRADDAGVLIADEDGRLSAVAATSENALVPMLMQLRGEDGPSIESYRRREPRSLPDLHAGDRWKAFGNASRKAGFSAVHAIPLSLRDDTLGTLTLYRRRTGPIEAGDALLGAALTGLATLHLQAGRALARSTSLNGQLKTALQTRIVIEQAKGILAERLELDMEGAFEAMRAYARYQRRRLDDVAREVICNSPTVARIVNHSAEPTARGGRR
ncbi:GAF and ANTAR domain-containing protein [Actinophytocola gossypii]|uniref:GAF and ANTAR domain-containing protein n=1 Tax=Actinophytocola gossypii TaxID=2812003 RepID=A0ABT2J9X1_9PSEU|nr:GAF and ANTAR domain-containing protein [Actinophytocola gossypii]MCT2584581.1 GAF and ANTAR domain-containing protein [Actinophytocola gossypii]